MSTSIITLKVTADDTSPKAVANAVRRAFGTLSEPLSESGEVKGVKFSVRPVKRRTAAPKTLSEAGVIRAWARANNVPVGERGRIHPDVKAAYQAAEVK